MMRAAVTTDELGFGVVELPDPAPAPDELVIAVTACGLCGSDLKARPFMPPDTVMGHEFGGAVVAVGADARRAGWKEGVAVAALPVASCGACASCRSGNVAHCAVARFIGMGVDAGGFAELAVVPARHAFALPAAISGDVAPLVEPFAVGLHAVETADVDDGASILVVGAGGVGLTTVAWAHVITAGRVTAVDPDPSRRAAALALGADDALLSIDEIEPGTYDAVIECVGRPELIAAAATAARPRGRVVIAGACDQPVTVEPIAALLKELSFRWSLAYRPNDFRAAIDAFATGRIDPDAVVGPTVGLDRLGEAFDLVRNSAAPGRVLVTPTLTDENDSSRPHDRGDRRS
jgi:(R,R)-butanediol dehydrogenase / meso-butanediol dehydrogenase / diacetyl reductase